MKLLPALFLITNCLFGQQRKYVGDTLPDFQFRQVMNYPQTAFAMSAFKGKLLLVEFWSTTCPACSSVMARLAKLKKKYAGQVDVMVLTKDDRDSLQSFLARHPQLAALKLPMMQLTAEWTAWFPHRSWPFMVWVGQDRKIIAIPDATLTNEKYIDRFLKEGSIDLPVRNDLLTPFDHMKPLSEPRIKTPVLYTSSLTGGIEGYGSHSGKGQLDSATMRYFTINADIKVLYGIAWRFRIALPAVNIDSRLLLNLHDSTYFQRDDFDRYKRFCYELIVSKKLVGSDANACVYMQQDLDRFFKIKSTIVKKKTMAWVLVPTDVVPVADKTPYELSLEEERHSNVSARSFVWIVEAIFPTELPVAYEGPSDKKVTLVLKKAYTSAEGLKKDLKKGGLDLVKKEKEVEFLELSN